MKPKFSIAILMLAAALPGSAQLVSSHAPTVGAQPFANTQSIDPVGRPVARVNGAVLTDRDLLREEYTIFPYARQHNGGVPRAMEADVRAGAMKMIVFEELVYQEALRRKMTIASERLQRAQVEFRKQFSTPQEFNDLLNSEFKGSRKLLNDKIERSLLIEKMMKLEVEDKSSATMAEARAFYDKNADKFQIPESYAVQTISIMPPANATPAQLKEAHKKADAALAQAKQTKSYDDFGLLAEKISEDDYRVMMGDHKAVDRGKLPPQVLQAISTMKPGEMSGLIDVGNSAYTIVRLNAHIAPGMQKFDDVKQPIRDYLKKQKTESLRGALDKRLRKNAKVEEL